jgi:hypothetical protein
MPGSDKQYFTITEANDSVDQLSELFGRVMQLRGQLKGLYVRLDEAGHPPTHEDLEAPELVLPEEDAELPAEAARDRAVFRGLVETLREQIESIQAIGCIIKDIEIGLVDWPAIHAGREVLLCWKYGETEVGHWHELHTGYDGRRPLSELEPDEPPESGGRV